MKIKQQKHTHTNLHRISRKDYGKNTNKCSMNKCANEWKLTGNQINSSITHNSQPTTPAKTRNKKRKQNKNGKNNQVPKFVEARACADIDTGCTAAEARDPNTIVPRTIDCCCRKPAAPLEHSAPENNEQQQQQQLEKEQEEDGQNV